MNSCSEPLAEVLEFLVQENFSATPLPSLSITLNPYLELG